MRNHSECADAIREGFAPSDYHVTTAPPIIQGTFTKEPFTCPHGVLFWAEPTGNQLMRWALIDQAAKRAKEEW